MDNPLGKWELEKVVIWFTCFRSFNRKNAIGSLVSMSGGDAWYNITVKNNTTYVSLITIIVKLCKGSILEQKTLRLLIV